MPTTTPASSALVRRLGAPDAEAYVALRRQMLASAPAAFLASPEHDRGCDLVEMRERMAAAEDWHAMFGAFTPDLVGAVGFVRPLQHPKASHKAMIWGMYVEPGSRGLRLGRRLLDAAVAHARSVAGVDVVQLSVSESAPEAAAMYAAAGFATWGVEPDSLRCDGRSYTETHMLLRL